MNRAHSDEQTMHCKFDSRERIQGITRRTIARHEIITDRDIFARVCVCLQ